VYRETERLVNGRPARSEHGWARQFGAALRRGLPAFILGAHCVAFLALEAADFARGNALGASDALSAAARPRNARFV
jgi:hypothetical protein